jgi:hypothetical protein
MAAYVSTIRGDCRGLVVAYPRAAEHRPPPPPLGPAHPIPLRYAPPRSNLSMIWDPYTNQSLSLRFLAHGLSLRFPGESPSSASPSTPDVWSLTVFFGILYVLAATQVKHFAMVGCGIFIFIHNKRLCLVSFSFSLTLHLSFVEPGKLLFLPMYFPFVLFLFKKIPSIKIQH